MPVSFPPTRGTESADEYQAPSAAVALALVACSKALASSIQTRTAAPWNRPTAPAWIQLQDAVGSYTKSSAQNGLTPERVIVQLTRMLQDLPRHPDRQSRLRAALIAFVLDSFSWEESSAQFYSGAHVGFERVER